MILVVVLLLKIFQFDRLSVKNGISEIINPITYNGGQSMVTRLVLHGFVLMAKDKKVDTLVKGGLFLGVLVEAGVRDVIVIASLHLVLEFLQSVVVRPF